MKNKNNCKFLEGIRNEEVSLYFNGNDGSYLLERIRQIYLNERTTSKKSSYLCVLNCSNEVNIFISVSIASFTHYMISY